MANRDAPFGFRPVRDPSGRIPKTAYKTATNTAIYEGDLVEFNTTGNVRTIDNTSSTANAVIGVAAHYRAASTTRSFVLVYDGPNTVFEVQSDGATDPGTTTPFSHAMNAAYVTITTGNTTTKRSKHELDYDTIAETTTAVPKSPLKVVGMSRRVGNDPALSHAVYEVIINKHALRPSVGPGRSAVE
jgi:hypothetical protein